MERQYVAFETAGSRFCIDIMDVQEVAREQNITRMPNFPEFVEGVINLRGVVIPIVSIEKKIGGVAKDGEAVRSSIRKYMIVKASGVTIGLMVDILDRIVSSDDSAVQNAEGMGHDAGLVTGILNVDGSLYLVLNARGILGVEETAALEKLDKSLNA